MFVGHVDGYMPHQISHSYKIRPTQEHLKNKSVPEIQETAVALAPLQVSDFSATQIVQVLVCCFFSRLRISQATPSL